MAGRLFPPLPQIEEFYESVVGISEAGFVDNDTGSDIAPPDGTHDLVKGKKDDVVQVWVEEPEEKVGSGVAPGNRDPSSPEIRHRRRAGGNDERPASPPESPPRPEETVIFPDEAEEMGGYLAYFQCPLEYKPVQGLHIFKTLPEGDSRALDQAMDQGIENKGVVGTGGKPQG
jgi:hypothetical protein